MSNNRDIKIGIKQDKVQGYVDLIQCKILPMDFKDRGYKNIGLNGLLAERLIRNSQASDLKSNERLEYLQTAMRVFPRYPKTYFNLGSLYHTAWTSKGRQSYLDDSIRCLTKAIDLSKRFKKTEKGEPESFSGYLECNELRARAMLGLGDEKGAKEGAIEDANMVIRYSSDEILKESAKGTLRDVTQR